MYRVMLQMGVLVWLQIVSSFKISLKCILNNTKIDPALNLQRFMPILTNYFI